MHLLVQVGHLHACLDEVAELFRQVGQQVLQVGDGAWLAVAGHCHHFPQLVVKRGVDGADGVFSAKKRLTSCREEENHLKLGYSELWCWN